MSGFSTHIILRLTAMTIGACYLHCLHDITIPMSNNVPSIVNAPDTLKTTLWYPDSLAGTFLIQDMNDSLIALDSSWPGSYSCSGSGYETKTITLFYPGDSMGVLRGTLSIVDPVSATMNIPYAITRRFKDPFESFSLMNCWQMYDPADSALFLKRVLFSDNDAVMQFVFPVDAAVGAAMCGIRSTFTVCGDYCCSIALTLRSGMFDGFETAFFMSTSADTGRYDGDVSGVFISGRNQEIQIKCKSVDGQVSLQSRSYLDGKILLARHSDTVCYMYQALGSAVSDTLARHLYAADTGLYVHLRMQVDNRITERDCKWNNFYLTQGDVAF